MIKKQKYSFDFVTGVCTPIDLTITSVDVVGGVRPLQVTWTPELAQDLEAYHNIDAEQELTNLLTQQIAAEIDREIIRDLLNVTPEPGNFEDIQFPLVRRVTANLLANDLVNVEPMNLPVGNLFYFTPNLEQEQEEFEMIWRTNDTWVYENLYGSLIGIMMELKPHEFIPKPKSAFDIINLPTVNRVFS